MLSRFFGKGNAPTGSGEPAKTPAPGGLEVRENDPDTAWAMWDDALASQSKIASAMAGATNAPSGSPTTPYPSLPPEGSAAVDFELPTQAMGLGDMGPERRKEAALAVVDEHHQRIGNTIRTMWGYPECSTYINKLIMAGGDGMGHNRVGFNQEAVDAMLALVDLHDAEFGAPPNPGGMTLG